VTERTPGQLVAYIDKAQAVDKVAALAAELRARPGAPLIFAVLSLEEYGVDSLGQLFELLAEVLDHVVVNGASPLHDEAVASFAAAGTSYDWVNRDERPDAADAQNVVRAVERVLGAASRLLLTVNGARKPLGRQLAASVRSTGGQVMLFHKSVHDQGAGLTTPDRSPGPADPIAASSDGLRQRWRRTLAVWSNLSVAAVISKLRSMAQAKPVRPDVYIAFNERHRSVLIQRGVDAERIAVTGYFLLYPRWQALARASAVGRANHHSGPITLFTRGETPGRSAHENVVPHKELSRLLIDVLAVRDEVCPHRKIRIKPHPIQDVDFLRSVIADHRDVEITYDPPSLLAAGSSLVITTYSSTAIDALIFGVPSVEYFQENDFFRRKHPTGSPFPALGVLKARERDELRTTVEHALSPGYVPPPIAELLGHSPDLSAFDPVSGERIPQRPGLPG